MPRLSIAMIDERLAGLERDVRAGEVYDNTLRLFRLTYFPPLGDSAAFKLVDAWAKRKNFQLALAGRTVDAAGRTLILPCLTIHA